MFEYRKVLDTEYYTYYTIKMLWIGDLNTFFNLYMSIMTTYAIQLPNILPPHNPNHHSLKFYKKDI